jgi:glyoxylase-like metal-dependent hydrolase (beta-lactamase superfamily II)
MKTPDVIVRGKDNGEGMVIHYQTTTGTDIFGLAIPNLHIDTDWNLGPTWCYLILGSKNTLIDTGRFGNYEVFKAALKETGKEISDIDRIIITHSHEDHDGNLAEILSASKSELWAHSIYRQMISYHPHIKDHARHPELPGSCRFCVMPEKFYKNCLPYHQKRSLLHVDWDIQDDQSLTNDDLGFMFTPGHSPDSICIVLEDEVLFTGDTILPDISPHPSMVREFEANRRILPERYCEENTTYGLTNYIKSLNKIAYFHSQPFQATFPGHRLFHNGQFNIIQSSSDRAKEIIQFHMERCDDILRIIGNRTVKEEYIAWQHFPASQLAGNGIFLALDEIRSHIEIMEECGDILWADDNKSLVQHSGSRNFLTVMGTDLH